MTAAIYYHPDAYDTSRPNLMGRHTAGEGFLSGYARYANTEPLYCYARMQRGYDEFCERVRQWNGGGRETRYRSA